MKRFVCLAVLAAAGPVFGQSLPAPLFANPDVTDSSSRAATTAWTRAQKFLSSTGDLSLATARPAGAPISRSLAARAADVYNVLDYGAVADGNTDIGPALNAIAAKLGSTASSNVIYFPNGVYRLATPVTFAGTAPMLVGQGFTQGPGAAGTGTWIKIDQTGFTPITFSGTNARGAKVRDLAFFQTHPAPGAGWAPTPYDYVFRIQDALGEVTFHNVLFAGVNRGIYADNSGRLNIEDVQGQFYTTGVEIDDCFDIPRIQRLHVWTFATSAPSVVSYQQAHADAVLMRRADGIFIGDLFALGMYSALHLSSGANGVTTKAYVSNLYADFVNHGVLIDGAGSDIQLANVTSQNNDQTNSGTTLPNGHAIWVNTNNATMQIANLYSKLTAGPSVQVDGFGNRVNIGNLRANTFGTPGAGTPAIFASDTGVNPGNQVYLGNKEQLQGVAPLVLFNTSTNSGRQRFVMMNDVGGGSQNEARAYTAGGGSAPQVAAIGADSNIDLNLNGKGSSGVRLQSSGQTVLRVDNPSASSNGMLLRGGSGSANWVAEGGDPNIDVTVSPKGPLGGIRLQGNGSTILRLDNQNAIANNILLRPSSGALNVIAEGADSNLDLVLSPKGGSAGVKLQSNAGTVLRVDNPSAGTSSLLVRSGAGTVALSVEDPTSSSNLVLNPKGTGLVSTGNCPPTTDNSNSLACMSTVKSWVLAQGFGAGGGGLTALTGDVIASGSGAVAATLVPSGVAPGTYSRVAVNAKGIVTFGSGLASSDVTGALGFTPANAATAAPLASPTFTGTPVVPGYAPTASLGPLAVQPAVTSAKILKTDASGNIAPAITQGSGSKVQLASGVATPGHLAAYDNTGSLVDAGLPSAPLRPVCSNTATYGDNGGAPAGYQYATRRVYYCPRGAVGIQLKYTGMTTDGNTPPNEANMATPIARFISVEPSVPAPWSATKSYVVGDLISYAPTNASAGISGATAASYAYNPYFVALAASTGVLPTPSASASWGPATPATPLPVTCRGARACVQGTSIGISGALETANVTTDYLPVQVPAGGFIAIRETVLAPYASVRLGTYQTMSAGSYTAFGSNVGDVTLSGNRLASGNAANLGPFAIVGVPLTPTPSVCIIADSRGVGLSGNGYGGLSVSSGGSGYTVGDVFSVVDSGQSADNVILSARGIVQTTTAGGVVSAVGLLDPGRYAIPGAGGSSTTTPSGTQATSGGTGTGLTIAAPTFSSTAGAYVDPANFANGLGSGFSQAGIPWVMLARSSDRLAQWVAQGGNKGRLAVIREAGCSSVLDALDYNDTNTGASATSIMAQHTLLAQQLLALGVSGVYLQTTPPGTNDATNFWSSTATQTQLAGGPVRIALNALKATASGSAPFAGIVDLASVLEVNASNVLTTGGGYIVSNGVNHGYTADGTHYTPLGQQAEAAKIVAFASNPGFQ